MIHIKVVRASHLAVGLAVAALVIALALILLGRASRREDASTAAQAAAQTECGGEGSAAFLAVWLPVGCAAPAQEKGRILIYHTHTHESYLQTPEAPYAEIEAWRTDDPEYSVVKVGESLAESLRALGYRVVHDCTDHEGGDMDGAYERSLQTVKSYEESFDLYIDLHRDAYDRVQTDRLEADGRRYARVMFLVGTGENFQEKPDYEANLAFARRATGALSRILPGSTRPVLTRENRYNQHVGVPAVLIEVGYTGNTLEEALNVVPALAQAIDEAMGE